MKKIMVTLLSLLAVLSLTACGAAAGQAGASSTDELSAEHAADNATANEASTKDAEFADDSEAADAAKVQSEEADAAEVQSEESGASETVPEEVDADGAQETKILVAYFSATHTTEGVATHIADGLNATLYEIVPAEPYTDADLNYNDDGSCTTIEMNDPDVRPAIAGAVEQMKQYTTVFLGYPIWLAYHNLIQCTQA